MEKLREAVYTEVITRLEGVNPNIDVDINLLQSIIEEAEYKIRNFCNIKKIPYSLKFVWTNIVFDYFMHLDTLKDIRTQSKGSADGVDIKNMMGNIRSIKEGDTMIESFDRKDVEDYQKKYLNARNLNLDDFVLNYKVDLYDFRKLRW